MADAAPWLSWVWATAAFTLVGSLSARKYHRPTFLVALAAALGCAAQAAAPAIVRLPLGPAAPFVPAGVVPLGIVALVLCAIVEKFGQPEGHRAALATTAAQAILLIAVGAAARLPAEPPFAERAAGYAALFRTDSWVGLSALMGFVTGANLCVVLYHMLRVITGDRRVWLRGLLAPLAGGSVETFVHLPLAYGGREDIGPWMASRLLAYALVAAASLPFLYAHRAIQGPRTTP